MLCRDNEEWCHSIKPVAFNLFSNVVTSRLFLNREAVWSEGAERLEPGTVCRMLLVGYFSRLLIFPTEVEGRRHGLCGAVWAAATSLTLPPFASAGSSDSENWWDRSLRIWSPRIKHDTGRTLMPGPRRDRRTSAWWCFFPPFSQPEFFSWH